MYPDSTWPPPAPPVNEHFTEAAQGHTTVQETSTATEQGQDTTGGQAPVQDASGPIDKTQSAEEAKLKQREEKLETPENPAIHNRPDDDELVREANAEAKLEAKRQAFFKKMSKTHDEDFGPKL